MAQLSHALVPVAVLCYVAAGLGFLVEFAFGRKVATPSREPELVPAGTGASSGPVDAPAPISPAPPSAARPGAVSIDPGRAAWFGRAALVVTALAVVVHITALVTRGLSVGRVPWGNMYEFVVALSLVGAVAFLVLVPAGRRCALSASSSRSRSRSCSAWPTRCSTPRPPRWCPPSTRTG